MSDIRPQKLRPVIQKGELQTWYWENFRHGDHADPLEVTFDVASAQVVGTYGGAVVTLWASLDGETFGAYPRAPGDTLSLKNSAVVSLAGPVKCVAPEVEGGDETTNLKIMIVAVSK